MATKITWEDKEGIQNDASIARKNKVMDDDMNEIKQTVNNNADELIEAQENIENLQGGQETAGADIKNLRSRVSILETENTTNKSDISSLKSDNTTNKENISTLQEQVSNKVDKVEGKGLSTNDYTTEEKQKLAGLKNYDDTEIKQNIADIKEEQQTQNKNIEQNTTKNKEQDELISKLKSALINVETEEAKSLHIEDASEVPAQLKILGNQEQETREGYNMLNSSLFDLSEVSDLATFNQKDGTITFNGTANTDINIRSLRKQIIAGTGKENILIKIISGSLNGILRLVAQDINYGNIKYSQIGTSAFNDKLIENVEYNIFSITITNGTVLNNLKLGFMIVDDSDVDKEYEQYGAMPSPGYSSPVVCLGSNKNEFNSSNAYNGYVAGEVGQKISYQSSTLSKTYKSCCKLIKNKNYTLSFNKNNPANTNVKVCAIADEDENILETFNLNPAEETLIITSTNTGYLYLVMDINATNIKIEEGTEATSYSPYGQGSTKISKINENLFDNKFEIGIIDTDGTERTASSARNIRTKNYTRVFEGHNYTIINGIKNNLLKGRLYDINKKFIGTSSQITSNTDDLIKTYTAKEGVAFIRFQLDFDDAETGQAVIDGQYPFAIYQDSDDTEYVEHEQTDYLLYIQQEMLAGDYFVKEEDGWKEVHNVGYYKFTGDENFKKRGVYNNLNVFYLEGADVPFMYKLQSYAKSGISTAFKTAKSISYSANNTIEEGIQLYYNSTSLIRAFYISVKDIETVEDLKAKIKEIDFDYYYTAEEPTKLACTEEQSAVLDELNNLNLFDGVNNIITAENIALLKLKYVADTKTYVDKEISDIKEQLNTINELLSTTATSSLLLDNLQNDLESEVM